MTTDNWINLIAAILIGGGTLALAFMTWKSIRRTRDMQKSEKRERLLNEIIEWASNAAKSAIYRQRTEHPALFKTKLEYKYHKSKGKYIGEIISSSFKELSDSFNGLNSKLDKAIKFTEQILDGKANVSSLKDYETEISFSAEKLLEKTAVIKTKDIRKKEESMSKEGEVTGSNEPNLKDIEGHLKQQDIRMKKGNYVTGAAFGAAIALVGISFMVQMSFQLSPYVYIWFFIVIGLGFMCWCWWKQSKVK